MNIAICALAPDGFPNNITSHNMSGSTIHLFWKEVSATERNGKVINYLIRWIKASTVHYNNTLASTLAISTKNSTFKNTTVTGLDPFSYYYFFLAAETAGGFGPEALISLKTDEAGRALSLQWLSFCSLMYNFSFMYRYLLKLDVLNTINYQT